MALSERNVGPELAVALDYLGTALTEAGRYEDALRALDRSLSLKEAAPSGPDVDIARTLEATAGRSSARATTNGQARLFVALPRFMGEGLSTIPRMRQR